MDMGSNESNQQQNFAVGMVVALAVLVATSAGGAMLFRSVNSAPVTVVEVADIAVADQGVPPALAAGAVEQDDNAYIRVEEGVVKFYFATGSADLPHGTDEALSDAVRIATQRGRKLGVSGYHDGTGDAAANVDLAKRRAQAVHKAILAQGVAGGNVVLRKPEMSHVEGRNDEARRVEVVIIE